MNILQKAIRSMSSLTGSFNDKLLKYYKQYGATSSVLQDAEKQYLVGRLGNKYYANQDYWKELDETFGDALPLEVSDILRKYGSDAHLYLPGVSPSQGFIPGNYIDSAGTQPAVYDQPVGLVLDAAGSVGAELAPTLATENWNTTNAVISGGVATASGVGAYQTFLSANCGIQPNKYYQVTYTISDYVSGQCYVNLGGYNDASPMRSGNGTFTEVQAVTNPASNSSAAFRHTLVGKVSIVSVREVTGIHASQQTVGHKPIERRGIVNLLAYSNDLTNANWTQNGGASVSANSLVAPDGSMTGTTIPMTALNYSGIYKESGFATTSGSVYTFAAICKYVSGAGSIIQLGGDGQNNWVKVNTQSKTIAGVGTSVTASSITPIANGWSLVVWTFTASTNTAAVVYQNAATAVTIGMAGYGLFAGTLTAAQILAAGGIPTTTTAPASSSAGNAYLEFDGVDDFMSLGSLPFQMADDHFTVVAASVSYFGGNQGIVCPAASASWGRAGALMTNISGNVMVQYVNDALTFSLDIVGPVVQKDTPFVLSTQKIGNTVTLRLNGVQVASGSVAGMGAFTPNNSYIGKGANSGDRHQGHIYWGDTIKGTLTLTDIQQLERFAAQRAGIQL